MLTCQICQHENPEGAEYCENCGAALEAGAGSAPAASPEQATTPDMSNMPDVADAPAMPDDASVAPPADEPLIDEAGTVPPESMETPATEPASEPAAAPATAPAGSGQRPRLLPIVHGAQTGDEYPLMGDRLLVGRFDAETGPVDIDLSDVPDAEQISRHHAEIYREGDGSWFVQDLGSTNGVFVKPSGSARFGPRLTAPQALSSGDELSFGNVRFLFQIG